MMSGPNTYQVLEELAMEQVQAGLHKELQANIDAQGPQILRIYSSAYKSTNSNMKEPKQRDAPHSHGGQSPSPTRSITNGRRERADTKQVVKEEVTCFRCGRTKHIARQCPERVLARGIYVFCVLEK